MIQADISWDIIDIDNKIQELEKHVRGPYMRLNNIPRTNTPEYEQQLSEAKDKEAFKALVLKIDGWEKDYYAPSPYKQLLMYCKEYKKSIKWKTVSAMCSCYSTLFIDDVEFGTFCRGYSYDGTSESSVIKDAVNRLITSPAVPKHL